MTFPIIYLVCGVCYAGWFLWRASEYSALTLGALLAIPLLICLWGAAVMFEGGLWLLDNLDAPIIPARKKGAAR